MSKEHTPSPLTTIYNRRLCVFQRQLALRAVEGSEPMLVLLAKYDADLERQEVEIIEAKQNEKRKSALSLLASLSA